jgi:hypothetical protein
LNLRSNQDSSTYPKFPNYPHPLRHLRRPSRRRSLRCRLRRHRHRILSPRRSSWRRASAGRSGCGGIRSAFGGLRGRAFAGRSGCGGIRGAFGVSKAAPGRPRTQPPPGSTPGQAARCSKHRSHPPSRHAPPKTQYTNSANPYIAHIQQTPNKNQALPDPSPSWPAP